MESGSDLDKALQKLNEDVMKGFGMEYSASHSEFIKGHESGEFYFLETASRVGGAHLAEMVEFASGVNLWAEWARIETAVARKEKYKLPKIKDFSAGILVSLSKYERPDTTSFDDKEIVWRVDKKHHLGMILQSKDRNRILTLLDQYCERVRHEFHASLPAKEKLVDIAD